MNSIQLKNNLLAGKELERHLVCLLHPEFAAATAGMTYRESYRSVDKLTYREVNMYEKFGVDFVAVNYLALRVITSQLLRKFEDIEQLSMTPYLFENDKQQQINYQAIQSIHQSIGQEVNILYGVSGPLTLARYLMPIEVILKSMRKNPSDLHRLLRFCTDILITMVKKFAELDYIHFIIYDPVASGSLLSPKQYQDFCLPYITELFQVMHTSSSLNFLHICGDTSNRLKLLSATGAAVLSIDQKVDMGLAWNQLQAETILMGNVDPVSILLQGNPDQVRKAVCQLKDSTQNYKQGLIIGSGCGIPHNVPEENIHALIAQAKAI